MTFILRLLFNALGLLLIANYVPGITISGFYPALMSALLLGFLNVLVRPLLILLTLPINILTLGLFSFVINASLFWFVASFIEGFAVEGFVSALIGSLLMSLVNIIGSRLINSKSVQGNAI